MYVGIYFKYILSLNIEKRDRNMILEIVFKIYFEFCKS